MTTLQFVYHVTTKKAYNKIKKNGLVPKIGKLSKEYGEKEKMIYFFINEEESDNALMNWLGEAIEEHYGEDIECVLLKVNLSKFNIIPKKDESGTVFFEQSVNFEIDPSLIEYVKDC